MSSARLSSFEVVVILGKRGSGKSNTGKGIAAEELAHGARVVALEIHDEWSQKGRPAKERKLGPLADHITVDQVLDSEGAVFDRKKLSLAVVLKGGYAERAAQLNEIGPMIRATGNLTLFIEECGAYDQRAHAEINEIATQSRHSAVPVVFLAQRAVQIPKTARDQASRIITGIQDDPDDLKWLEKKCGKDIAAQVSRLPRGKLIEWRDPR
jgi:hypothetical protein